MLSKNKLKEILTEDPSNSRANELLAYILANEGDLVKAHELLLIANKDKNSTAECNYYLGVSYIKKNEFENAIKYIEIALSKNGVFFEGLIDLAIAYGQLSDYRKSEEILLNVINLYPQKKYIPYINIGKLKSRQKEYEKAIFYFDKALQTESKSEEALINLAAVYFDIENYHESLNILYRIIELNKNNEKAILNIAATLNKLGRYSESIEWSEKILNNNINNELALINFAESLSGQKNYRASLEIYNRISNLSESYTKILNNKGVIFDKLNEYENALHCFEEVIKINDLSEDTLANKAKILNEIQKYVEALTCIDKAIAINFNKIEYHLIKAFILFNMGDYEKAWIEYEWRNKKNNEEIEKIKIIKKLEHWNGISNDKKLIIWGEQGLGDQILFSSALKEIVELNIQPTVIISKKMISVFKHSFPECRFISLSDSINLTDYGYQISIISLQKYFRKKLSDFNKIKIPYLSFTNNSIEILNKDNKIICGLSWKSFNNEIGCEKSIPLEGLNEIFTNAKIKYLDIQYYPPNENEELNIDRNKIEKIKNANFYENFELLVQVIDCCDIIVTCSNTTAHVAGAMGKKTYLLLPKYKGKNWYWKHINRKSIFYPTIIVLEQTKTGSWVEPIRELNEILINI